MRSAFMLPFLVLLSGGWAISSCDDNSPSAPPEEGVYLVSRQRTYKQGDEIQVRVLNATNTAKTFFTCGSVAFYLYYRRLDGEWVNASGMCNEFPPQRRHLAAFESLTLSVGHNVGLPSGEYRVGDSFCEVGGACEAAFSEPFRLLGESGSESDANLAWPFQGHHGWRGCGSHQHRRGGWWLRGAMEVEIAT